MRAQCTVVADLRPPPPVGPAVFVLASLLGWRLNDLGRMGGSCRQRSGPFGFYQGTKDSLSHEPLREEQHDDGTGDYAHQ